MKLQHLPACLLLLVVAAPLACGGADDDVMLGNDHGGDKSSAGSGGSKSSAGSTSGGDATSAGSQSGGSSSTGGKTGTAGSASAGSATGGSAGSGGYQPCAGKACGASCSPCDPNNADCIAPAVEQTCTALGQCTIGRPNCSTPPTCEDGQQYYAPGCSEIARPAEPIVAPPFVAGCYTPCTAVQACPAGHICVSAWYDPSSACDPGGPCAAACGATVDLCFPIEK